MGALLALWVALAAISAVILVGVQKDSREEIETRFQLRSDLTADFIETYVTDFIEQERTAAEQTLAGAHPSRQSFNLLVAALQSETAVLLDAKGRAIFVAPRVKKLIGTNLARRFDHLASAVGGEAAVSNVVTSAAAGIPIVAFATPFKSVDGRRVFSPAFDISSTPLAPYLESAVIKPNRAYLVDAAGVVISTNHPESLEAAELPADVAGYGTKSTMGSFSESEKFVISRPVDGTPWQLVMTTPKKFLYQTIGGATRLVPWLVWLGFVGGSLLSILLVTRLLSRRRKLAELNVLLDRQANVDPLTGVANRRRAEDEIKREIKRAEREGEPLSLLMVDIDRFKEINDACGHRGGDRVLREVADLVGKTLRDTDTLGRWGGDEFIVALPRIDAEAAAAVAERLLERVRTTPVVNDDGVISTTISIGGAEWAGDDAEALVHRADEALYLAKAAGRDRFELASSEPAELVPEQG